MAARDIKIQAETAKGVKTQTETAKDIKAQTETKTDSKLKAEFESVKKGAEDVLGAIMEMLTQKTLLPVPDSSIATWINESKIFSPSPENHQKLPPFTCRPDLKANVAKLNENMLLAFLLADRLDEVLGEMNEEERLQLGPEYNNENFVEALYQAFLNCDFCQKINLRDPKAFKEKELAFYAYVEKHLPKIWKNPEMGAKLMWSPENFNVAETLQQFFHLKQNLLKGMNADEKPAATLLDNAKMDFFKKNSEEIGLIRKSASILEHFGHHLQKIPMDNWPRLWHMHNSMVDLGLFLIESKYPGYKWGLKFMFADSLEQSCKELFALYLAEKIADYLFSIKDQGDGKEVSAELKEWLKEFLSSENDKELPFDLISKLKKILLSREGIQGFPVEKINEWCEGLHQLASFHAFFKAELKVIQDSVNDVTNKIPRILLVGDSVTAGVGVPDAELYKRCIHRVLEILMEWGLPCEIVNASVPGDKTGQGLAKMGKRLDQYGADMVVITQGGNDILGKPVLDESVLKQLKSNIKQAIQICTDRGIKAVAHGFDIPEWFPDAKKWGEKIAGTIKNGQLVPGIVAKLQDEMKGQSDAAFFAPEGKLTYDMMSGDRIHPTGEGHEVLAQHIAKLLAGTLKTTWYTICSSKSPEKDQEKAGQKSASDQKQKVESFEKRKPKPYDDEVTSYYDMIRKRTAELSKSYGLKSAVIAENCTQVRRPQDIMVK